MNCPNCGLSNAENARFCQNCGYNFDSIPQVKPIQIEIPQQQTPNYQNQSYQNNVPPNYGQIPPQILTQLPPKSGSNKALILFLSLLVFLLGIGLAIFGYLYLTRNSQRSVATSTNTTNANNAPVVKSSPIPTSTPYEDWKNKVAPEDKRETLVDAQTEITNGDDYRITFSIPESAKSARIVGGFKVTKGESVDVTIYPPESDNLIYGQKSTREKKLNLRLESGDYVLTFAPSKGGDSTVASELFLVYD